MTLDTHQVEWQQLEKLFYAALELEPHDRPGFLDEACGSNRDLRRKAESLVAAIGKTESFLRGPIAEAVESLEMPDVEEGQRFGSYEILRLVGAGGMGTVYVASRADDLYEQRVAIKVARAPLAGDPGMLSRFRSERQILANLDHPNIGRLLDGGITSDGIPFLVMEYVEGVPIDVFCERTALNTAARLALFQSVCSAVEYAHRHLVVHRDIKPANILVNGEGVPKLLDFGIAKLLEPSLETQAHMATVDLMMTPSYASPEQVRCEPVSTATDVYALGVLLYKLLTGCLPFQVDKSPPLEAAMIICEHAPTSPSEMVRRCKAAPAHGSPADAQRTLRGDLDNIVLTALRKEPTHRYASVGELSADIAAYFNGYPIKARASSRRYRITKYVRRHMTGVLAGAAMLLALFTFTIAMTLERNRANREAETSRRVTDFMTDMFKVTDPSLSHGDTVTAREILDKASAGIGGGLSKDPTVQARLMRAMGSSYRNLGLYAKSIGLLERAVALQTQLLGDSNPETLQTMSVLGAAYGNLDKYAESEKLLRWTLAAQQRILGPENDATMVTTDSLADTLTREGHYAEAEGILRRVLAAQRRILGPASRPTLLSENRLVDNLRNQGRFAEAETMARASMETNKRVLGLYDFVTLSSIEELALIVINEGHPEEAEKLDREGFRISTHMYGPNDQHTLLELGDIGDALQEQGRLAEAEPIQRDVVERLRKAAGAKAAHTIEMMTTFAITLSLEKKFAEAESVSRDALEASLQTLGAASEQSIDNTVDLALILAHEKRMDESQTLFKRAVSSSSKGEGNELANVLYAYAEGMAVLGHRDEAMSLLKDAVDHGFSNRQGMNSDEDLKSLRTDPRYQRLLGSMP